MHSIKQVTSNIFYDIGVTGVLPATHPPALSDSLFRSTDHEMLACRPPLSIFCVSLESHCFSPPTAAHGGREGRRNAGSLQCRTPCAVCLAGASFPFLQQRTSSLRLIHRILSHAVGIRRWILSSLVRTCHGADYAFPSLAPADAERRSVGPLERRNFILSWTTGRP